MILLSQVTSQMTHVPELPTCRIKTAAASVLFHLAVFTSFPLLYVFGLFILPALVALSEEWFAHTKLTLPPRGRLTMLWHAETALVATRL